MPRAHHVPGVRAFDLLAHAHAAGAQDAAVVVDDEAVVRTIHLHLRVAIREVHVRDLQTLRQGLQFAVAVGDADRADVVALGEEQLQNRAPIAVQALRVGRDLHALGDAGHAGGQQLVGALDLDQAQPAGADGRQAPQVAQGRDEDLVLARDGQDGFILARADVLAVDLQRLDVRCPGS